MNETPSPPRSCIGRSVAVLVGLFATWQLVALVAANLMLFVPLRPSGPPLDSSLSVYQERGTFTDVEPLQSTVERAAHVFELWTEASGEEQGWSLFAPGPPPYSVFVATELQWADGSRETVRSRYEPRDLANPPLRAPLIDFRHYHFEAQFVYAVWYANPETVAEHPRMWDGKTDMVRAARTQIREWLRWRLNEYRAANPDRGCPQAVVMKHRYISTPHPDQPADAPRKIDERPFARWFPGTDEMEAFDAVAQRFVSLEEVKP